MTKPYTFGVVGSAWRARLFVEVARRVPEQFALVGAAVRRPEAVEAISAAWGVPTFLSPGEMVQKARPEFVVTAVPRAVNPSLVAEVVDLGVPVLTETPPAANLDAMREMWAGVGARRLVQVAEQYLLYPDHAARRQLVGQGLIGEATSVEISSTHGYHAISLMRGLLGLLGSNAEPVTVNTSVFTAPLVDPLLRSGWTDDDEAKPARTVLSTIDFGGRSALYDFTDNQWHNQLRFRRLVVRGSRGEISDEKVVRLAGPRTILKSPLVRSQLGYDLNLDGYDTEHISFEGRVVYRNPYLGHRFMDEEIAVAGIMAATGAWARDEGAPPYPLADGCQDQLVALAIDESGEKRQPVTTGVEAWAKG